MKTHLFIEETIYKVDEKNKVVVCIMQCDLQMHKHPAWCIFNSAFWETKMPYVKWNGSFIVRAKARCNETDAFNVETGKRIAESRAKAKAYKTGFKIWNIIGEKFKKLTKSSLLWAQACNTSMKQELNHVKELTE